MTERVVLIVQAWSSECESCGYGKGGWTSSPALEDPPREPLTPQSRVCNGCGQRFTHVHDVYSLAGPVEITPEDAAA
jgi:hypothetical protein